MAEAPVHIRLATAEDAPALARLAGQLGYPTSETAARGRLADLPAGDEIQVAVAEGNVVGWIHLTVQRMLLVEPIAVICGLVVDEAWRGRGVGKMLLAGAETYAVDRGIAALWVRSNAIRERAHAFYRREGFVETKVSLTFSRPVSRTVATSGPGSGRSRPESGR